MGWKTFRDRIAFFLIFLIPGLWAADKWLEMPEQAQGALVFAWALILQFYFRKRASNEEGG